MYDYKENIIEDIKQYIKENYELLEDAKRDEDRGELYDDLFIADSVTGNASGSYYCNSWKAGEALQGNWDLLREALEAFGEEDINAIEKGEEWCDVSIRCYLVGECLADAIEELEEEGWGASEEDEEGGF